MDMINRLKSERERDGKIGKRKSKNRTERGGLKEKQN